ncbi:MAG: hypothetical protein OXG49_15325 [Chloroflexi bacterium]|nr:hypothetical protein [Chloroflexota bacterium]
MNFKTLTKLAKLAMMVGPFIPKIEFIIKLLNQYNHALAKSYSSNEFKPDRKAGFVYVIRDKENSDRFKMGYRAKPPWLDAQLKRELGPRVEFALNFPAKDAGALEKRLRTVFGNRKKGEWFTISEIERRTVQIIAALVMVAAGDTLEMAPVDEDDLNLAKDLLKNLGELATETLVKKVLANAQPGAEEVPIETVPDFANIPTMPDLDWNWESVLTKDYRALPKLSGKEAYLTVICDNNAKVGKVFIDSHPAKSIDIALAEQWHGFALELTLIMKVDKRKKVRRILQSYADELGENGWVSFSDEAMGDVKQLARPFFYGFKPFLRPKTHWGLKTLASQSYRRLPELRGQKGYVCVVQGSRCGNRYKIWRTQLPRDTGGLTGMAAQLNNPHDALHARKRVRYSCIIQADHAETFETFLKERYSKSRRRHYFYETSDWYTLTSSQLQEIRNFGR